MGKWSNNGSNVIGFSSTGTNSYVSSKPAKRCYTGHPELKLGKGVLLGACCSDPRHGFDVYIGLSWDTKFMNRGYPWGKGNQIINVEFPIQDMHAPKTGYETEQFLLMVTWICNQLQEGKKIHVGCFGGHGRTGLVLSAVIAELKGEKAAIQWVRQNYCHKAVETKEQVKFLMHHYGVEKVEGSKEGFSLLPSNTKAGKSKDKGENYHGTGWVSGSDNVIRPVASRKSIWRDDQ